MTDRPMATEAPAAEMTLVDAVPRRTAVIHGRMRPRDLPAFLGPAFETVAAVVASQGTHVTGPPFTAYRVLTGDQFEVEAGFPVAGGISPERGVVPGALPGGRTVETIHIGPYETLAGTYQAMHEWLRERELRPAPLMWEYYLTDPADPAHRHEDGPRTLVVQLLAVGTPVEVPVS